MRAVVLFSGGMDSATCLALAQHEGFEVVALTVDYGQRHRQEIACARALAAQRRVADHRVLTLDLRAIGGSALTDDIAVPKHRSLPARTAAAADIPITYVPARNTIFLSLALGLAEVVQASAIFIGATSVDYSGYPDCRPAFFEAFDALARVATAGGLRGERLVLRTPLLELSKAAIIKLGAELGLDHRQTLSCYDPDGAGQACGGCDACQLRRRGFVEAGLPDPTRYANIAATADRPPPSDATNPSNAVPAPENPWPNG